MMQDNYLMQYIDALIERCTNKTFSKPWSIIFDQIYYDFSKNDAWINK